MACVHSSHGESHEHAASVVDIFHAGPQPLAVCIPIIEIQGAAEVTPFLLFEVFSFRFFLYFFCICSYLSSIHEKANCIAIFWTRRPHSLGSCHFRGVWATCLPHKGGGVPLSALPKVTTSKLAGLFSTTSHKCRAPSREAVDTIF